MAQILQASQQMSLEDLLTRITSSHIERKDGVIALFMCSISPSCKIPELLLNPNATRIELSAGDVRVWLYEFTPRKPDFIIEGAYIARKIRSSASIVKS